LHDYKRALEDCQAGIRLNPAFAKIYKRLFKAHICLGNVAEAKQALDIAIEADPNDSTNKSDKNLMEEVLHSAAMIEKCGAEDRGMNEDIDYEKAASYCNSIMKNCPGSVHYACLKIENLLRSN
jgi:tetratricopeptide (TPR) repeat protein